MEESARDAHAQGAVEGYLQNVKDGKTSFQWDTLWGLGLSDKLMRHTPNALWRAWASVMDDSFRSIDTTWESVKDWIDVTAIERANRHLDAGRFDIAQTIMEDAMRSASARKEADTQRRDRERRRQEAELAEAKYQQDKRARRAAAGAAPDPKETALVDDARLRIMSKKEDEMDMGFKLQTGRKKNKG
jgi:hypothetical protein